MRNTQRTRTPAYDPEVDYVKRCGWDDTTEAGMAEEFLGRSGLDAEFSEWRNREAFDELVERGELGEANEPVERGGPREVNEPRRAPGFEPDGIGSVECGGGFAGCFRDKDATDGVTYWLRDDGRFVTERHLDGRVRIFDTAADAWFAVRDLLSGGKHRNE